MKSEEQIQCVCLFLFLQLIMQSAGQYPICSDFYSPMVIKTHGTGVGYLRLPRQGVQYKSNQLCEWTISTEFAGYGIRLDIIKSNLQGRDLNGECNNDYVDIFDYIGDHPVFMDRFCSTDEGKVFYTASSKMTIRFHSDAYFEFSGFQAMYQPVPVGPNKEQEGEDKRNMYALVGGIPGGLLCLAVVIIILMVTVRHFRLKKNAASSPLPSAHTQNAPPGHNHHRGHPAPGISNPTGHGRQRNVRSIGSSRSMPAQTSMPGSANEGGRSERSVTPPPAYDSLDFGSREVDSCGLPLTPPPYELIVKQQETIN